MPPVMMMVVMAVPVVAVEMAMPPVAMTVVVMMAVTVTVPMMMMLRLLREPFNGQRLRRKRGCGHRGQEGDNRNNRRSQGHFC